MHDLVASFYGGYEQVGLLRRRRIHLTRTTVLIVVTTVVTIILVGIGAVGH